MCTLSYKSPGSARIHNESIWVMSAVRSSNWCSLCILQWTELNRSGGTCVRVEYVLASSWAFSWNNTTNATWWWCLGALLTASLFWSNLHSLVKNLAFIFSCHRCLEPLLKDRFYCFKAEWYAHIHPVDQQFGFILQGLQEALQLWLLLISIPGPPFIFLKHVPTYYMSLLFVIFRAPIC